MMQIMAHRENKKINNDEMARIFIPLQKEILSPDEQVRIRGTLLKHIHEYPATAPLLVRFSDARARCSDRLNQLRIQIHPVAISLVLVLFLGVGTSFAAETALPGEPLYVIKTGVNERIQGVFALSETAKAQWNAVLADRRLTEAETLAAEGRLTSNAQATIQTGLEAAVTDFNSSTAALANAGDTQDLHVAKSNLDVALTAHVDVLSALSVALPKTNENVAPILQYVRGKSHEQSQTGSAQIPIPIHAERMQREDAEAPAVIATTSSSTSSSPSEHITDIAPADTATADSQMEQGEYEKALGTYRSALRAAYDKGENADTLKIHLENSLRKHAIDVHIGI